MRPRLGGRRSESREGIFYRGLPYLAFGDGPPLVVFSGLSGENTNPRGVARMVEVRPLKPLGHQFTVYLVNRKPGLQSGTTIEDLAGHYADAITQEFTGPVDIIGSSTGGSIAQQFAIDYPDLVKRLVLVDTACQLSLYGRQVQRRLAELTKAGQPRRAWAQVGPALAATDFGGRLLTTLMWLMGPAMDPDDPSDLLTTINAEDAFHACKELHRVTAPSLLVAGERDRFYSPDLFRETADAIPTCRLHLYPGKGHGILNHKPAVREVLEFIRTDRREPERL